MKIGKVDADYGDAIRLYMATNVWVDHCDLYGDRSVGKDTYDGLVDLSHAADWVTVSHTYFHDHVSCLVLNSLGGAPVVYPSGRNGSRGEA